MPRLRPRRGIKIPMLCAFADHEQQLLRLLRQSNPEGPGGDLKSNRILRQAHRTGRAGAGSIRKYSVGFVERLKSKAPNPGNEPGVIDPVLQTVRRQPASLSNFAGRDDLAFRIDEAWPPPEPSQPLKVDRPGPRRHWTPSRGRRSTASSTTRPDCASSPIISLMGPTAA